VYVFADWINLATLTFPNNDDFQWAEGRIGWHEDDVHDALHQHGELFLPGLHGQSAVVKPRRVFVPLCGKAVDMAFLARSPAVSQVVGVDGVFQAIEAFRQEHADLVIVEIPAAEADATKVLVGGSNKLKLLCTDFFSLDSHQMEGKFDVIFDRGSLVAIDPSLRRDYVRIESELLVDEGSILLVAIERVAGTDWDKEGPPFSLSKEDVICLYGSGWDVQCLREGGEEKRNAGTDMVSSYYKIARSTPRRDTS
jgi:thiopurine S-methyltransferase